MTFGREVEVGQTQYRHLGHAVGADPRVSSPPNTCTWVISAISSCTPHGQMTSFWSTRCCVSLMVSDSQDKMYSWTFERPAEIKVAGRMLVAEEDLAGIGSGLVAGGPPEPASLRSARLVGHGGSTALTTSRILGLLPQPHDREQNGSEGQPHDPQ